LIARGDFEDFWSLPLAQGQARIRRKTMKRIGGRTMKRTFGLLCVLLFAAYMMMTWAAVARADVVLAILQQ
jgi:hypothetical protein